MHEASPCSVSLFLKCRNALSSEATMPSAPWTPEIGCCHQEIRSTRNRRERSASCSDGHRSFRAAADEGVGARRHLPLYPRVSECSTCVTECRTLEHSGQVSNTRSHMSNTRLHVGTGEGDFTLSTVPDGSFHQFRTGDLKVPKFSLSVRTGSPSGNSIH